MSLVYQRTDSHLVDYELYKLGGCQGLFRGPPVTHSDYIACVGGAQTFGRFVQAPFPRLLADSLEIEALNLGRGGAGPTFPLHSPGLLEHVNSARLVIVQFFSGRSQANSLFRTERHGMYGTNLETGEQMSADQFYAWLMGRDVELAQRIVAETRAGYVTSMCQLLEAIRPPKILLWLSVRTPEYPERWELPIWRVWGQFPQFVNRAMVEQVRSHANAYIECVSTRGSPQPITDSDGNAALNRYYPSPEMHQDAAALLLPVCRALLAQ